MAGLPNPSCHKQSEMFLIIHNPLSNNKKSKKTTNKMVKFFKRNQIKFKVRSTLKIENLLTFLDNNKTITDILYLGGDGSINYLINSVDVSKITQKIYLAKSGSGNDFLRSLKQKGTANVTISVAETNQKTVRFINGCGLGIDAAVCYYVNNDAKKNRLSYFKNVFKAVLTYDRASVEVDVDGIGYSYKNAYLAAVQNGKYFGGGMKVAPNADIEDDSYHVCVAHNLNKALLQMLLPTIYPGFHVHIRKRIAMLKGKEIQVRISDTKNFQADGEVLENVDTIKVRKECSREFIAFNKRRIKKELKERKNG